MPGCTAPAIWPAAFPTAPFDGDLPLFTADEEIPGYRRDPLHLPGAWRPHVGGRLWVHGVPDHHYRMMREESLARIGPVPAAALDRARS
ncbi:hypothetical protein [Streptomyces sp. NA02950]|uniref:hypothetical protein n=1 Tax=Streptomyces sp. NA02950 TaxID=2742137 RepID=UPI0020CAB271|nr:hypothetical protein [Streptomyces sp. NA02950]